MARIAGVNLPNQKRLEIGLTYIYGIGQPTARKVALALELDPLHALPREQMAWRELLVPTRDA